MGVIRNAMVLLGISSFLQGIVIGFIIIFAVLLDRIRRWLTSSDYGSGFPGLLESLGVFVYSGKDRYA